MNMTSGYFFLERGDFLERRHCAGGRFVMDQGQGIELACGESGVDLPWENGAAPIDLKSLGGLAAFFGDVEPLVRECAAHAI